MIKAVGYYLSVPFLYLISILPWSFIYILSNGLAFLLHKVFKYRIKIIEMNLRNSFPQKSESEIATIVENYYLFVCDVFLETLKIPSLTKSNFEKHIKFANPEVIYELDKQNKSYFFVLGHFGNWEWAGIPFFSHSKIPLYSVYKTLENEYFDNWFIRLRSKFGAKLIPNQQVARHLTEHKNIPTATALVADQSAFANQSQWLTFLNQDTAVFRGPDKLARKFDCAIIYSAVKQIKRGYYEVHFELITQNPKDEPENSILERIMGNLERDITEYPATWLWSHNRWKTKKHELANF